LGGSGFGFGSVLTGVCVMVLIIGLVMGGAAFVMVRGLMAIPAAKDNGIEPKIPLENEKVVPVARMKIDGNEYALWDVRDNSTNVLKFMILADPGTGQRILDSSIQSRAFAIRLALQAAYLVKSINDQAHNAQDAAGQLAALGKVAAYGAEYVGQGRIIEKIRDIASQMEEKTAPALVLAATLDENKDSAKALTDQPSDRNANLFLTNLGLTAAQAAAAGSSQEAAFICFLFSAALRQGSIPIGSWLQQIYDSITGGSNPSLSLLSQTFGTYETAQTTSALNARGVY
jgi:hypothetical protein